MKTNKIFIILIAVFLVLTTGCSNKNKDGGNKITVEKQVSQTDKYEYYRGIEDNNEVQKAKEILESINWENAKVSMASPPHYKFYFEGADDKQNRLIYELWISPNKDRIELVIGSKSKYAQLSKEKSVDLFKIISGKNLIDI